MKFKLGVVYNFFNEIELLKLSVLRMLKHSEDIVIVWQRISWTGNHASVVELDQLVDFAAKSKHLKLIEFTKPIPRILNIRKARAYDVSKKNIGLRYLRQRGCSHFLLMDADEFYIEKQFSLAWDFIKKNKITHSALPIIDYVKEDLRFLEIREYSVPFIHRLTQFSFLLGVSNLPVRVDSTRTLLLFPFINKFYYFTSIRMHHYTLIRGDLNQKLNNSLSNLTLTGRNHIKNYSQKVSEIEQNLEKNTVPNTITISTQLGILIKVKKII